LKKEALCDVADQINLLTFINAKVVGDRASITLDPIACVCEVPFLPGYGG
jgi:hypothetical protein